ncbi:MAG: GNAT family N-acetyltransferase [Dehalococcoidia bacterium]|nr:GNAT family N-acetyltransferase [Dehalococcoidia bacterium]
MTIEVVRMGPPWASAVAALWAREFGSSRVASSGLIHDLPALPTLVALHDDAFAGVVAYRFDGDGGCEVVGLASAVPAVGAGTALLEAVAAEARAVGCRRAWLVTTNDNLGALRFYQLRGWRLAALRVDEVTRARATLKPEIPARGVDAIPIRDEIELELPLV